MSPGAGATGLRSSHNASGLPEHPTTHRPLQDRLPTPARRAEGPASHPPARLPAALRPPSTHTLEAWAHATVSNPRAQREFLQTTVLNSMHMSQSPTPEENLAALGLSLPPLPSPGGNYVPAKQA